MLIHEKVLFAAFLFSTLLNVRDARAQNTSLMDTIRSIAKDVDGMVGVSVLYPERNGSIKHNGSQAPGALCGINIIAGRRGLGPLRSTLTGCCAPGRRKKAIQKATGNSYLSNRE